MRWLLGICLCVSVALSVDLIQVYRMQGIDKVKEIFENSLQDEKYWQQYLKNVDTRYGYYEDMDYVLISQKSIPDLKVYEYKDNNFTEILKDNALVGEAKGDKEVEGDLKTPVGAYDLTAKLTKLDQFYGPMAFVTSYPNLLDKLQGKSGSGIWIHGVPLNGDREIKTKGCIAVKNDFLKSIDSTIKHDKSVLIISEDKFKETSKDTVATVISSLYKWRDSWRDSDLERYISFYSDDFRRFDGKKINEFKQMKKQIFSKNEKKTIIFEKINVTPYPSIDGKEYFRVNYFQKYYAPSYTFEGDKEIYIRMENGKMKIIAEK